MAHNEMVLASHSPYSPDLAPSDFSLFGHVNGLLRGESFETEAIVIGGRGHFEVVGKVNFDKVFLEWMTRLERCIEINSDYVG
jgi:hypothetical protein